MRARAVDRYIAKGATVVDIGAGAGALGVILRERRPDVTYRFREPDPELQELLAERFGNQSKAAVPLNVEGPACAVLMDVIEHVEDDAALLRSVAAELPRGAVIAVTVPALQLLWSKWDVTVGHHRRYNRRQLRATFARAGLDLIGTRYIFLELMPVALVRRVFRLDSGEDFPPISGWLNALFYGLGAATQALGRLTPCGTSIVGAAVVKKSAA